jgi:two-component system, cell cycle sensor histidine kinase and response regulator CckA
MRQYVPEVVDSRGKRSARLLLCMEWNPMTDTESRLMATGAEGSSTRSLRTVDDLRTGDNACFIYSSEEEYQAVLVSFVRTGLELRQRLIYIHDMRSPESVRSMLRESGIDIDHAEFREQVLFVPAKQIYARGAGYSYERVLDQLHAMTALALADGWSALRVTSEMTWVLRQTQGTERLLAHEGRMASFYRDSAALGMGQFDRGKFPAEALLDVLLAHPVAVLGTEAVHNFYHTPQVEVSGGWRSEATLAKWLSSLKERKRATENMREALQLHREVLDNVGSGILVIDRDGRVVQCNPFAERFLGVQGLDEQGHRLSELFPAMGADSCDLVLARVLDGETVLSPDINIPRPGTTEPCWIIATLAPYRNPEARIIGAIATVSDITSRKKMEVALRSSEDQLRETQKLEAVGRLAGGVAHDMNNALNAIIAFADLALQEAGDNQGLRDDIGEIRTAADRAAGITRRLLAFSRRQVLQPQVVEVNAIVASVEDMLRRLVGDRITMSLRLAPDAGWVRSDPAQIEQVIINLALNARDAMPDGGHLIVETDVLHLEVEREGAFDTIAAGDYAVLRIFDSGCGMTPDILAHAFEPFFTTKDTTRGSGLGLPVVYGIVKQSGGQIRVHSELGKGTRVEIYLAHVPESVLSEVAAVGGACNETVLLVEDEALVRKVVARILERAGYRVLVASSGDEALAMCERIPTPIDALVTDVVMPGMGGRELADRVTERFPDLKVLFMTGFTDDELLRRGILDQGRDIMVKPFSPKDLLRRLREILNA